MKAGFRHILLIALLLRALVPLGWMPGSAALGQSVFIICAADGSVTHGTPGKDDAGSRHEPCAFAAAHVMAPPEAGAFALPLLQATAMDHMAAPAILRVAAAFTPQAPRAPPVSA
jgi:hypothetical protein